MAGRAFDLLVACGVFILFYFLVSTYVGSSSLTRGRIPGFGSATEVTGPPGKSHQ